MNSDCFLCQEHRNIKSPLTFPNPFFLTDEELGLQKERANEHLIKYLKDHGHQRGIDWSKIYQDEMERRKSL